MNKTIPRATSRTEDGGRGDDVGGEVTGRERRRGDEQKQKLG